jgi:hypothetical protein
MMVYFFTLRSNSPIVKDLSQEELAVIEHILAANGIHVKIEAIQYGAIVYLDDSFPKEQFLRFKKTYLENTQVCDAGHLPAKYMTWHDSVTGETIHFADPLDQYLHNKLAATREFIGSELGSMLMRDIYTRIVSEGHIHANR